jgi:two-component system LytT family sensor kinase
LSDIFQSKACIDRAGPAGEAAELRAAIPGNGVAWGVVHILPRPDEVPFFSEDADLLRMLARALGSALDGQRLRDQGVAREQRERELMLSAARSELKALRAQINPHFLFNALNTIAALIPARPERAEQTVEQLAEVVRYAVRRSDREWVRLAEEVDFVRAYLEIEQARFGERLRVEIDVERATEHVGIPALVIQTLAENAVKHGIATMRGQGVITISSRSIGDKVLVSVRDNGPGFGVAFALDASAESTSGGYGLRNVQERLFAYYGAGARLRFARDIDAAATVVSFEIPALVHVGETG